MDRAVANLQRFTRASLATAVHAASRNPARMLGLQELGEIAVGQPANFNAFSADGSLQSTILHGHLVKHA
jgi:N-acetylglucosamine-6-phosphate deacetylase